jgi:hypothetical protein
MRTEHVTRGPLPLPREPSPRRFLRWGVSRRVPSTAILFWILAGMVLPPTEVGAGSITYSVVNYPSVQNGYTVAGTITTNGTTGTFLPGSDITSWDITIEKAGVTVASLTPADSYATGSYFDATTRSITVATVPDVLAFQETAQNTSIAWANIADSIGYAGSTPTQLLWSATLSPATLTIASVPEPSSVVLALTGAVAAILTYGGSRHRRKQRQHAAA